MQAEARIVDAMVDVAFENGFAGASVTAVCARARVSRRTFYGLYDGRERCFLAVLDVGHARMAALLADGFDDVRGEHGLQAVLAGLRGALVRMLGYLDAQPRLARVWLIESLAAGAWALERRERHLATLTRLIVDRWGGYASQPHALAAAGVMASVVGAIQAHLLARRPEPLVGLLGPLMGLVTAPYLDRRAVWAEIECSQARAQALLAARVNGEAHGPGRLFRLQEPASVPGVIAHPRAHRARACLRYVAEHPEASNRQVADGVGLASRTQTSTLLARLAAHGLLAKRPCAPGQANRWRLTSFGAEAMSRAALGVSDRAVHS